MPKRILMIKTSSMGDVIHALPALTDAKNAMPDLIVDWVVEKNFAPILKWHPAVNQVIEIEFRKWRKTPWKSAWEGKWKSLYRALRQENYDYVIDAQGLMKSVFLCFLAKGKRFGFDVSSVREPLAAVFYHQKIGVSKNLHAVTRLRQLFSKVLGYPCPNDLPNYGIAENFLSTNKNDLLALMSSKGVRLEGPFVVFLHGTTWETKLWPEGYWQKLGQLLSEKNIPICIPWGNLVEKERAERIAGNNEKIQVLSSMSLFELATLLSKAKAVVAVDTGLAHLSAALAVPTFSIYGPTNAKLTGTIGLNQHHLAAEFSCSPCLQKKCTYTGQSAVKPACFSGITPEIICGQVMAEML